MPDGQGSCSNGGIERGENMNDVRELIPELDLISVEHTSLMPTGESKRIDLAPVRERKDRRARWMLRTIAALLTMNMLQWVIIYILQAGPV